MWTIIRGHLEHTAVPACLALFALAFADPGDAREHRPAQVPHGKIASCGTCHTRPSGGGPRNDFGEMIEADFLSEPGYESDVVWGPELAALDADGDGFTNGQELQDPEGSWRCCGDQPGDASAVTQPGDADSHPPATAVTASTWGALKRAVEALLR